MKTYYLELQTDEGETKRHKFRAKNLNKAQRNKERLVNNHTVVSFTYEDETGELVDVEND